MENEKSLRDCSADEMNEFYCRHLEEQLPQVRELREKMFVTMSSLRASGGDSIPATNTYSALAQLETAMLRDLVQAKRAAQAK